MGNISPVSFLFFFSTTLFVSMATTSRKLTPFKKREMASVL